MVNDFIILIHSFFIRRTWRTITFIFYYK